jgi:hypothetical protein
MFSFGKPKKPALPQAFPPMNFGKVEEQKKGETKSGGLEEMSSDKILLGCDIDLLSSKPEPHLIVNELVKLAPNKIHFYEAITIQKNGILTTEPFKKGENNGILRIRCVGNLIIEKGGKIDVSELGYLGGLNSGISSDGIDPQGMSYDEKIGIKSLAANFGGGGGGQSSSKYGSIAGGGGGYGTDGKEADHNRYSGKDNPGAKGGKAYSDEKLTEGLKLGSGGGAGSLYSNSESDKNKWPHGGHGGGALEIIAPEIEIKDGGGIYSNGQNGKSGQTTYASGGGGGSGGTILIRTPKLINNGEIIAKGGLGGKQGPNSNCNGINSIGGLGGFGRIRLDVFDFEKNTGKIEPQPYIVECDVQFEMSSAFQISLRKLYNASIILHAFTKDQADVIKNNDGNHTKDNNEIIVKDKGILLKGEENKGENKGENNEETKKDQNNMQSLINDIQKINFDEFNVEIVVTNELLNQLDEFKNQIEIVRQLIKVTSAATAKERVVLGAVVKAISAYRQQITTCDIGYANAKEEKRRLDELLNLNNTIKEKNNEIELLKKRPLCSTLQLHTEYKRIRKKRIVKNNINILPLPDGFVPIIQEMRNLPTPYHNKFHPKKGINTINRTRNILMSIQKNIRNVSLNDPKGCDPKIQDQLIKLKEKRNIARLNHVNALHKALIIPIKNEDVVTTSSSLQTQIHTFETILLDIEHQKVLYTQRSSLYQSRLKNENPEDDGDDDDNGETKGETKTTTKLPKKRNSKSMKDDGDGNDDDDDDDNGETKSNKKNKNKIDDSDGDNKELSSMRGWMHKKRSGMFKGFTNRYFMLNDTMMYYFKSPEDATFFFNMKTNHSTSLRMDSSVSARGEINLKNVKKIRVSPKTKLPASGKGIELHTPDRLWLLCPATEDEFHHWLSVISRIVEPRSNAQDIKLSDLQIIHDIPVSKALKEFDQWRDNSLKLKVVNKTDKAMEIYLGTILLNLQNGLLSNDDHYNEMKLHDLMMTTFNILKEEDKAWTDKNPIFYLPMQIIRDGKKIRFICIICRCLLFFSKTGYISSSSSFFSNMFHYSYFKIGSVYLYRIR